ncbi:MAG: hypothetical protein ABSE45_10480 [Candidatus Acidiferrales bacterium]|jgi:hypothetical protein
MKGSEVFDTCHARYRGLREWLKDSSGSVRALDFDTASGGYLWRPDRARACEYVADFERIGRQALRRRDWKGRLKLFNVYFLRGAEYRRAVALVGVSENTFDYWYREVKRVVGAEFSRTGLFPPGRYFHVRGITETEQFASPGARVAGVDEQIPQQGNAQSERHVEDVFQQV